ncbi:hypothetical protein, partial [Bacteroides heparinolyticus]
YIIRLCVVARREKPARCCKPVAEPLQIWLHCHCNQLAPPLQKACNVTATGLQQNCNECAAEQIEKVMKHHPCQQSMFCNPNAVISFLSIDCARQYKKFIPIIGSYPK